MLLSLVLACLIFPGECWACSVKFQGKILLNNSLNVSSISFTTFILSFLVTDNCSVCVIQGGCRRNLSEAGLVISCGRCLLCGQLCRQVQFCFSLCMNHLWFTNVSCVFFPCVFVSSTSGNLYCPLKLIKI